MSAAGVRGLADTLADIVGEQGVLAGASAAAFATDVYRAREAPAFVVRPQTVDQLQAIVRTAAAASATILARGGGASYTDGYLPQSPGAVLIDMGGLNRILDVDETNATVTVEAGVTWAALKAALDARGLRTPFWGPFSGIAATVGGSMSQNTLSHGSGRHGISAQSVLSFDIVLADGALLRTGSAAQGAAPFNRHAGPDLAGLFCGDCGAFGIKARITLPLLRAARASLTASFAFTSLTALHAGMRTASMEALDDTNFAFDRALAQGQIARQDSVGSMLAIALSVARTSPSLPAALAQLGRMAIAGRSDIARAAYACHYIIEGVDLGEARSRLHRLRRVLAQHGREIADSVAAVVRATPFAPLYNTLGPKGERWVPVHGVLAHRNVEAFHADLDAIYTARAPEMARLGVWTGSMFEVVQSTGFLYEIALYWPDAQSAYHEAAIPATYRATLPIYPENLAARTFVETLKQDIVDLFSIHGAVHFQIGKMYPYATRLDATALKSMQAVKAALDPKGIMNPGALGL